MNVVPRAAFSQNCSSATPLFYVDLTGQPNGVWQSPPILRDGDCCGTDVNCIEFIVTLDSMATGILFNIVAGAVPGGALYYQLNCGPLTSIGTPICLSGAGPHDITFCKPGNNLNVYEIASIGIPDVSGTEWVSEACSGFMTISGLDSSTTTWTSIPSNPVYDSFLSCTSGCNNVTINPYGILPPYIDYQVCGFPIGGCYTTPFCDIMRVNFVNTLAVAITPQNPVICFGAPPAMVTANATGGNDPYNYLWSTGATSQSISVGPGTYYVSLTDSMNCYVANDSVVVSSMSSMITASAGPDQVLCLNNTVAQLNGSVTAASGGQWSGGSGTFNPNNNTLNAQYTPSQTEINNGSVQLTLITIGNNTCPADTDQVIISISPNPAPQIQGNNVVCEISTTTYTTPFISSHSYVWNVSGGTILSTVNNSITVQWGLAGNGSISVTETNSLLCDSTVSINITIAPQPAPIINGAQNVCTTTITTYNTPFTSGNTYAWTVTGGTISGPANGASVNILWNIPGSGSVSVTEINAQGCDSTISIIPNVYTQPAPVLSGPDTLCAMQTVTYSTPLIAGNIYNWNVTGGTVLSNSGNSISVQWPVSGTGTVSVTENNTNACDSTVMLNILIAPQPTPVISGPITNCTTTISQYSVATPVNGNTYSWIVNGGIIQGSPIGTTLNVLWNTPGNAFITLYESNPLGCDSSISVTASILTMPAPFISGPDTVCEMQSITYSIPLVAGNTYSWNVMGGTVISNSGNSILVQWPINGNGIVSVTESNGNTCDSTVSINVIIAPQPAPVINGPLINCTTTTSQYSVASPSGGNNYSWIVNGGTILGSSTGTTVTILWATQTTATITLNESNSLGCDSTVSITASIFTMPAPFIAGPDTVCEMQSITYSTINIPGNAYTWNVSGGTVLNTNNNSITVLWPSNGTGSISVTESNSNACDSTVTETIVIAPQPAPVINGSAISCTGTSTTYNVSVPVPGNTYAWTVTGGTITGASNGTTVNVQWTFPGTATISLTESNMYGCDSTVGITVNVLTIPAPSISGPDTVCALHTFVYSTTAVAGNSYSWNVTGGTIISTNNNMITVSWPANGTGTVSLTESNTSSCTITVSTTIFIAPQPVPVITGNFTSCTGTYQQFTISNFTPGNSYQWNVTGGTITGPANGTGVNVFWTTAGQGTVSFTESNNLGCDSTVTENITLLQKPAPEITGPPVLCEDTQATYNAGTFIPSHTYLWSVTNGTIIGLNVGNSIDVLWNFPGTGNVSLRQISTNGCDSITSINVVVNPLPAPAIAGPPVMCENESAIYSVNPVPGNTYQWSATGGIINGSTISPQISIAWTSGTAANVYLTETTASGCSRFIQLPVQIRNKPEPAVQGSSVGCISNNANNYLTIPEPDINYIWNVTGGNILSGNGSNAITVQWQNAGTQNITLTAVNAITGCDSTVTFNVQTGALPEPVIQLPAFSGCIPLSAPFAGNVVNPNYNYSWNFGDGTTAQGPAPVHQYSLPGIYNIQLIATNNTGCADTVISQVEAFPIPDAQFNLWHGTDPYYANISTLTLTNLSIGASSYLWNFDDGFTSSEFEPQYQYTTPGYYTISLVVTNQYGCRDVAVTNLEVKLPEDLYIPNAFTPNGDNKNDYFSVVAYNIDQFKINIFNRWGRIIYSSTDSQFKWDGTFNGTDVIDGVYVYTVEAEGLYGARFNLNGTVTVIK